MSGNVHLNNSSVVDKSKYRFLLGLALAVLAVLLVGCGGGGDRFDDSSPLFSVQIYSDPNADGDIAFSPPATYTLSSAGITGNILTGIDPVSGAEYRGFLDFPLRGGNGVPPGAVIDSAILEIFINSVTDPLPDHTVPLLIDLVAFQPPTLIDSDFDRNALPPLLTMPFDIYASDAGALVAIDVTALMDEAQFQGLPDFQLRLVLDFIASAGLVDIDDSVAATAPLLTVTYY